MLWRITISLLAAAGLIFACSPRMPDPVANARPRAAGADRGVVSHVTVDTANGAVNFAISVNNESAKRVELSFADGQTHDFVVLDSAGREVWRWSAGRLFTQAMQNRLVDAYDSTVYREHWSSGAPGTYSLVAELRSENHPVRRRVDFSIR